MRELVTVGLLWAVAAAASCSSTSDGGVAGGSASGGASSTGGSGPGGSGAGGSGPGGSGAGGSGGGGAASGSYDGTWALKLVLTTLTDTGLSTIKAPNTTIARTEQIQNGSSLTITLTTCDMDFGDGSGGFTIIVPPGFVAAMPVETINAEVTGSSLHVPKFWQVRSVSLANPETDPLPTDPADPRVLDWDQDGHPGLTLTVQSAIPGLSGDVYIIQRNWLELTSTSATVDAVNGTVSWGMEQVILDATSAALTVLPGGQATTDPAENNFRHRRIDPAKTCADIVAEQDAIFQ
jgi:hypothetical protein